jgi:16S rRNA processing protein RimM
MNKDDCYSIGYVAKPHGLKGEVSAVFTEPIELSELDALFLEVKGNLVPYFIHSFSERPDKAFIKFEEINTQEQAAGIKGCVIYLNKETRPALKRGSFYNDEVIGFTVEDENEGILGILTQVMQSGPSRLLQLQYLGKEVLIPVNGPFIKSVNKSKKLIKVSLPEGFLDI